MVSLSFQWTYSSKIVFPWTWWNSFTWATKSFSLQNSLSQNLQCKMLSSEISTVLVSKGEHLAQVQGERLDTSIYLSKKFACWFCTLCPVTFPLCFFQILLAFRQKKPIVFFNHSISRQSSSYLLKRFHFIQLEANSL